MKCAFSLQFEGSKILCKKNGAVCLYQYWCNTDKAYVSTAGPDKCKMYEERKIKPKEDK